MKRLLFHFRAFVILLFSFVVIECNSQSEKDKMESCIDRQAIVAGTFYSDKPDILETQLESFFSKADKLETDGEVLAIIAPHASYIYSGQVAASAYQQIDRNKKYDNIFVIASSHRVLFKGASIYKQGDYITPLGKVKVNIELANMLIDENDIFSFNPDAHSAEHSLEVQLPFLQYALKNDFQIVPIVTGTQTLKEVNEIAKVLKPYFNDKNLFVISSDFSHYPKYEDAVSVDKKTADAILSNSVHNLINVINENASAGINNLATSLCGWPSVLTLLNITEKDNAIDVIHVDYQNSGDVLEDKSRVVGYHAIVFVKNKITDMSENTYNLSKEEKEVLLNIARETIDEYLASGKYPVVDKYQLTDVMKTNCGAFVTLHKEGELRGCIGRFVANEPLYEIVQKMAVAAATEDLRFPTVKKDEMQKIDLEISVLTPLRKIESIDEIEMGKHGIYIKKGFASGTFLPQVATETGWTKEEFLGYCSRNKAGIGWEGWKDADIYVYEALVFGENEIKK